MVEQYVNQIQQAYNLVLKSLFIPEHSKNVKNIKVQNSVIQEVKVAVVRFRPTISKFFNSSS